MSWTVSKIDWWDSKDNWGKGESKDLESNIVTMPNIDLISKSINSLLSISPTAQSIFDDFDNKNMTVRISQAYVGKSAYIYGLKDLSGAFTPLANPYVQYNLLK